MGGFDVRLFLTLLACKQSCTGNKLVRTTHIVRFFFVVWCLRDDWMLLRTRCTCVHASEGQAANSDIGLHSSSRYLVSECALHVSDIRIANSACTCYGATYSFAICDEHSTGRMHLCLLASFDWFTFILECRSRFYRCWKRQRALLSPGTCNSISTVNGWLASRCPVHQA
jgi:hypothetical protein